MIRSKLSRSAVSAAIGTAVAVAMSTVAFTPVFAAEGDPVVTWQSQIVDGTSYYPKTLPAAEAVKCEAVAADTVTVLPCEVQGYSAEVGAHVLTAVVTTDAGSFTSPTTISYTVLKAYRLKGFYAPVKNGKLTRKAGSTIPFKFKVYVDDVKAKSKDVVASFLATPVTCADQTVATGAAVPVATAHKGFTLKYRDGAFHQNWKSPKLPKAAKVKGKKVAVTACYRVTMTTQDASSISALVTLK